MWNYLAAVLLILSVAACSTTPGDAARRGGHYEQAANLYEKRANQGDPQAVQKLGHLYNLRPGLPEDHKKAVHWYKRAIELGDIPSHWFVGVIYREGGGNISKDNQLAEYFFKEGAEKGQHYSMYDLAGMHADNLTKENNDVQGLMWIEVVTIFSTNCPKSNEGCQYILRDPKGIRTKLESRMNPSEISKAKDLARNWVQEWNQKKK